MRRFAFWLSVLLPALAVAYGVCRGSFSLGVPGQWTWQRIAPTEPLWLALGPSLVAAALYLGLVWIGACRVDRCRAWELRAWLFGLVVGGFAWLWVAQEGAPDNYQLSKAVWVLYFRGSSGYFTEANEQAGDLQAYLAGYESKMAEGDVLHIGTHPPGLIVAFRVLLGICREFPTLVDATLATQSDSVQAAFGAFDATSFRPRSLSAVERAALWLAAMLVQWGAVLTIVPLFGLLRMTCSRRASWLAAAFWPTMPALAIFLPKADCLYPLLATTILWLWLKALVRRSRLLAVLAGVVLFLSLSLSLAFLPIALVALLAGLWVSSDEREAIETRSASAGVESLPRSRCGLAWLDSSSKLSIICRRLLPAAGWGAVGFAIPCLATGWFLQLNLFKVWWLNFQNHAGFYGQFPRTYWKWLLVNPLELTAAAGVPLTVLAIWSIAWHWRQALAQTSRARTLNALSPDARMSGHVWAWLLALGLLWLSGKNMGEAARLWILFMPFLPWSAGPLFESPSSSPLSREAQPSAMLPAGDICTSLAANTWCVALAVQLVTTAAIVTHVAGFDFR